MSSNVGVADVQATAPAPTEVAGRSEGVPAATGGEVAGHAEEGGTSLTVGAGSSGHTGVVTLKATIVDGPIGIALGADRSIGSVAPESQAARQGVQPGDVLVAVGERDVRAEAAADVLAAIRSLPRPLVLTFQRGQPAPGPIAAGEAPAGKAVEGRRITLPKVALPNPAEARAVVVQVGQDARAAVGRASKMMTGLITTGVSVMQALDHVVERTLDDGRRGAAATVKEMRHTGLRLSAVQLDLRAGRLGGATLTPTPADAGWDGVHAFHAAQRRCVDALVHQNTELVRRAMEVDTQLCAAKAHMARRQAGWQRLVDVMKADLPALTAHAQQCAQRAAALREAIVALEGKLTSLSLSKAERHHDAWARSQHHLTEEYRSGREIALRGAAARMEAAILHEAMQERTAAAGDGATPDLTPAGAGPSLEEAGLAAVQRVSATATHLSVAFASLTAQVTKSVSDGMAQAGRAMTLPAALASKPRAESSGDGGEKETSSGGKAELAPASTVEGALPTPNSGRVKVIAKMFEDMAAGSGGDEGDAATAAVAGSGEAGARARGGKRPTSAKSAGPAPTSGEQREEEATAPSTSVASRDEAAVDEPPAASSSGAAPSGGDASGATAATGGEAVGDAGASATPAPVTGASGGAGGKKGGGGGGGKKGSKK